MKYLPIILVLCAAASCTKQDIPAPPVNDLQQEPVSCEFGITNFNLTKREAISEELSGKKKPPRFNWSNVVSGQSGIPSVILLDFDGHTVSNTPWNTFGDIICSPSNLSYEAAGNVFNRIANDYSPFNVIITTDESVFNNAPADKRMRLIFTESWEWFGQAGGTAFLNSFGMTNNIPSFVFTSLLNYNTKTIAEAGSHELGHTLGLSHQASYNGQVLTSPYNYGTGTGQTGWAPIMGCGYYQNVTTWHNGATSNGYNQLQDEVSLLTTKLGSLADDYSSTTTGAQALISSKQGVIHNSSDVDCFYIDASSPVTVTAIPFHIASGNLGANLDLVLKVYNSQGQLVNTVNDPAILDAGTSLASGEYFVSVSVASNNYSSSYGMLGKYTISLD